MSVHMVRKKEHRWKQLTERQVVAMFIARRPHELTQALYDELTQVLVRRPDLINLIWEQTDELPTRRFELTLLGRSFLRLKCGRRI